MMALKLPDDAYLVCLGYGIVFMLIGKKVTAQINLCINFYSMCYIQKLLL